VVFTREKGYFGGILRVGVPCGFKLEPSRVWLLVVGGTATRHCPHALIHFFAFHDTLLAKAKKMRTTSLLTIAYFNLAVEQVMQPRNGGA
jgi:hypothetical protein